MKPDQNRNKQQAQQQQRQTQQIQQEELKSQEALEEDMEPETEEAGTDTEEEVQQSERGLTEVSNPVDESPFVQPKDFLQSYHYHNRHRFHR